MRVQLCGVAKTWDLEGAPDFQHYRAVEGRARSPGIRLGRGTRRSSLNLHPQTNHKRVSSHSGHPWVLGKATATLTHKTHHGPNSGEATTFPHIVFSATLRGGYIQMALFPETPKLESRNCLETVPDALSSPGVNPLEGSPKYSCGKLGLERRSRLPTLERGRGSSWEPRD